MLSLPHFSVVEFCSFFEVFAIFLKSRSLVRGNRGEAIATTTQEMLLILNFQWESRRNDLLDFVIPDALVSILSVSNKNLVGTNRLAQLESD